MTTAHRASPPGPGSYPSLSQSESSPFELVPHLDDFVFWEWIIPSREVRYAPKWRTILRDPNFPLRMSVKEWLSRIHARDLKALKAEGWSIALGKKSEYDIVFRIKRGGGGWAWLLCQGAVTQWKDEAPYIVSGVCCDISRLRADSTFQQTVAGVRATWYHAMLENSPDLIVRMDRDLFPLYMNPMISRYFKRRRDEFTCQESAEELGVEQAYIHFLQHNVDRVFNEKIAIREMWSFKTAYGHYVTGEYSFWPEFSQEGFVVSVMTQFHDMTEKIQAEKLAHLNEMRLGALNKLTQLENVSEEEVLHFVLTSMRLITGSSHSFFFIPENGLTGPGRMYWSRDQGTDVSEDIRRTDRLPGELLELTRNPSGSVTYRCLKNGDGASALTRIMDNQVVITRCIIAPGMEEDHLMCLAGVWDKPTEYDESDRQQIETFINGAWLILRRFRHMHELRQAKEAAESAKAAMAEFLANVNHELRTPLTSILGYAETMVSLDPEDVTARTHCLGVIQRHARQMHTLVRDLLTLTRIEGSTVPLELTHASLADIVRGVVDLTRTELEAKNLKVAVSVPDSLRVMADTHFLSQVFRNLLENAVRYATPGSEIELLARQRTEDAIVSVSNLGPQIAEDDLIRIFERFYRGRHNLPGQRSTGIGLSICKHVVERHGGSIWAENIPSGVALRFTLPLAGPSGTDEPA